jgi:hypothetical protein
MFEKDEWMDGWMDERKGTRLRRRRVQVDEENERMSGWKMVDDRCVREKENMHKQNGWKQTQREAREPMRTERIQGNHEDGLRVKHRIKQKERRKQTLRRRCADLHPELFNDDHDQKRTAPEQVPSRPSGVLRLSSVSSAC